MSSLLPTHAFGCMGTLHFLMDRFGGLQLPDRLEADLLHGHTCIELYRCEGSDVHVHGVVLRLVHMELVVHIEDQRVLLIRLDETSARIVR